MKEEKVRKMVRECYGHVAQNRSACCTSTPCSCPSQTSEEVNRTLGYSTEELRSVPTGANLGLGCGNPTALAALKREEIVLDLGSGAGFDCFLAAQKVGKMGKVIGVDMTPEMLDKAKTNARKGHYTNVEFRLGEIENLPVADNSVNVIISNCVINLSPNKNRVFEEAFRVLAPTGRLLVSDIVLLKALPSLLRKNVEAYVGCLAGADLKDTYLDRIRHAGFQEVTIVEEKKFPLESLVSESTIQTLIQTLKIPAAQVTEIRASALSVYVSAVKPRKR
ncbi:MAG: arsenite methyltransferase [Candidatus Bathyarchaeota archaeon]